MIEYTYRLAILLICNITLVCCTSIDVTEGDITFAINTQILDIDVKSSSESEVTSEQIEDFTFWVDGTKIGGTYGTIKNETY